MTHRSFFWFVLPSGIAMLLFIFLPIISVVLQSVFIEHAQIIREVENCGPFGCQTTTSIDREAMAAIRAEAPLGRFAGLSIYTDRGHLAFDAVARLWSESAGPGAFLSGLLNLPFYKALAFTLAYTALVTPATIVLGFVIALAVNATAQALRGPLIFVSLLPFIITPLVGSLVLFWMLDARGILGAALQWIAGDPSLSVKASTPLMWAMLMVYGIWHSAPFAFVVYYAGLQTVNRDTLEAAMVDGASRWDRVRHVVIPHLLPLTTFVALIQLMDNFRVFEPIVSFSASAHATSLSWAIYNDLGGETRQLSSAAATSVLTILGVSILLLPVIRRTWRSFERT